jgi:hypothetical protein
MNSIIYVDNDPTKPVIYIGCILFFCQDKKIKFLLLENSSAKFDDIGIGLDIEDINYDSESDNENINNNLNNNLIDTIIIKALRLHTNYLLDITPEYIEKSYTKQVYIPSEMALIKFISVSEDTIIDFQNINLKIIDLKSEDFGMYTVKSNEDKIKRYIKWIEKSYFFRTLHRFNKISKKLNNKEVLDAMRTVESENKLKRVLKSIRKKIVGSTI